MRVMLPFFVLILLQTSLLRPALANGEAEEKGEGAGELAQVDSEPAALSWTYWVLGVPSFQKSGFVPGVLLRAKVGRNVFGQTTLGQALGYCPWFRQITPIVLLGQMPLKNHDHHNYLVAQWRVQYVLSIQDPWEQDETISATPVQGADWDSLGVTHELISSPDAQGIDVPLIDKAVSLLEKWHAEIKELKKEHPLIPFKIFIHCMSGIGRSATITAAYLMKTQGLSVGDAIGEVSRLKTDTHINEEQESSLVKYATEHLSGSGSDIKADA